MSPLPASLKQGTPRPDQVQILSKHVLQQLRRHRVDFNKDHDKREKGERAPPLVVGVQGPQGSGKTTVTLALRDVLAQPPHNLSVAAFSIDDLYLPHSDLVSVAQSNPTNVLLSGRGQPGTHDVSLGRQILQSLSLINSQHGVASKTSIEVQDPAMASTSTSTSASTSSSVVRIPRFDKSAFNGEGDRSEEWTQVKGPVDVVLFEGWCLSFSALGPGELRERYRAAKEEWDGTSDSRMDLTKGIGETTSSNAESTIPAATKPCPEGKRQGQRPYFLDHPLEHLMTIDGHLKEWSEAWYGFVHAFVQLMPVTEEEAGRAEAEAEAEEEAKAQRPNDGTAKVEDPTKPKHHSDSDAEGKDDLDNDMDTLLRGLPTSPSQPSAEGLQLVFRWREEAERKMKEGNGGIGMSEEGVRTFVARYMPGYELFSDGVNDAHAPWRGRGLRVALDHQRRVRGVGRF